MIAFLLATFFINQFDVLFFSLAQPPPRINQDKKDGNKERRVRLSPVGSLILPMGYKAVHLKGHIDAWSGYFISADCSFRVSYTAGLVQTPFETDQDKISWIKTETTKMGLLKYGLKRTKDTEQIIASIGEMNFYTPNKKDTDLQMVLDLLRTFERGQCKNCEPALPESSSTSNCTGARPADGL